MTEKVTISRDAHNAFDAVKCGMSNEKIIKGWFDGGLSYWQELAEMPLDTLIRALYIGYEIERSPEEDVANYLAVLGKKTAEDGSNAHWQDELIGAQTVIHKLGIQLPEPTEGADAN